MKKLLILLTLCFGVFTLKAQQEEYATFLQNALKAAKNSDQKGFTTNLKYFSVAIERDNIRPDVLFKKQHLFISGLFI